MIMQVSLSSNTLADNRSENHASEFQLARRTVKSKIADINYYPTGQIDDAIQQMAKLEGLEKQLQAYVGQLADLIGNATKNQNAITGIGNKVIALKDEIKLSSHLLGELLETVVEQLTAQGMNVSKSEAGCSVIMRTQKGHRAVRTLNEALNFLFKSSQRGNSIFQGSVKAFDVAMEAAGTIGLAKDVELASKIEVLGSKLRLMTGITEAFGSFAIFSFAMLPVDDLVAHLEHNEKMITDPSYCRRVLEALESIFQLRQKKKQHEPADNTNLQINTRYKNTNHNETNCNRIKQFLDQEDQYQKILNFKDKLLDTNYYDQEYQQIEREAKFKN